MNMINSVYDYSVRLCAFKTALDVNAWEHDDVAVRHAFHRMFFDLSAVGKNLAHQIQRPVEVPDVVGVDDGHVIFGTKIYNPAIDCVQSMLFESCAHA